MIFARRTCILTLALGEKDLRNEVIIFQKGATKNAVAFTSRPFFTCHLVVLPLGAHMSNLGRTLMMQTSYYVHYLFPNNGIIKLSAQFEYQLAR